MKRATLIFLSCVGALTLLLVPARWVVGWRSDENMIRKQFGSPKAIQALAELYGRVEKDGATLEPARAKSREIPIDWIPVELWKKWGEVKERHNRVVAYFDDKGALIAIEFADPCRGCFISRDPSRCPESYNSLYRLADKPLYVTAVVKDPE